VRKGKRSFKPLRGDSKEVIDISNKNKPKISYQAKMGSQKLDAFFGEERQEKKEE